MTPDEDSVMSPTKLSSNKLTRRSSSEKDPEITQAKWRKQMIGALPKLFDSLRFYFQSINRSVITKEELMHMIISTRIEIVDQREVEEQLRLLQEFAPDL